MNIGLIAHDAKKKSDAEFLYCIPRNIVVNTICMQQRRQERLIEECNQPELFISFLPGHLGGNQQLGAQIEQNEIDAADLFERSASQMPSLMNRM